MPVSFRQGDFSSSKGNKAKPHVLCSLTQFLSHATQYHACLMTHGKQSPKKQLNTFSIPHQPFSQITQAVTTPADQLVPRAHVPGGPTLHHTVKLNAMGMSTWPFPEEDE